MKKHLILLLLTLTTSLSFAQQSYQDVVYLKNGSIIRGMIIEQIPNTSIKIETSDRNVFVFQMDEIEKIAKEQMENTKPEKSNGFQKRKGYIGLSLGPSFPVGEFGDESYGLATTGLQFNLINFGYLFSDHFGISALWMGGANPLDAEGYDPWSYGGLMAGLLLSAPLSERVAIDFRPMVGIASTTVPDLAFGEEQASAVAFNFGTVFRFNIGGKGALLIHADYFSTKPEFEGYGFQQNVGTISLGFGIALRLK